MIEKRRIEVGAKWAGMRADAVVLAACESATRRSVSKAFEEKCVLTCEDGSTIAKGAKLNAGDKMWIERLYEADDLCVKAEPEAPLEVVYEDPLLVGVNKRAGQACHPIDFEECGTLAGAFVARYPEVTEVGDDPLAPGLVHRIDGGTSGLVLVARTAAAYADIRAQFAAQTVVKEYLALVEGCVERAGAVSGLLAHTYKNGQMRMAIASPGHHGARALKAETFFRPIGAEPNGTTRLSITIRTGVTHQIRSQLASIGHPIVGDTLYSAKARTEWLPGTHALHSFRATFFHPFLHKNITLQAPAPF